MSQIPPQELPCTACGNAACELTVPAVDGMVRGALNMLLRRFGPVDDSQPLYGFSAAQVAEVLELRCIPCVDANNKRTPTDGN